MPLAWSEAEREEFRQKLIEELSLTRYVRTTPTPALAKSLGVDLDVLLLAQKLARSGFAPAEDAGIKIRDLHIFSPRALAGPVMVIAKKSGFRVKRGEGTAVGQMVRALMHAAMQTEREPERRPHGQWGPLPGQEDARYRLAGEQEKRAANYHTTTHVTEGLYRAIELRARAEGVSRARYVTLWTADLVDGLLGKLPLIPVSLWQLYGDARAYVLPVRRPIEDSASGAPADKNAGPLPTAATPPALSPCPPEGHARGGR